MKRIFIIRHGKTVFNREKRLQGVGADSPLILNEQELRKYDQLAAYLSQYHFSQAYSSPLPRARATADLILERLTNNSELGAQTIDDLREIAYGQWEGQKREDLIKDHFSLFQKVSRRENDPELQALGIEDFRLAGQRFAAAIRRIAQNLGQDENALVFGHGGINQLGIKTLTKNENLLGVRNLSTSIVTELTDGNFGLDVYNQTAYLDAVDLNEGNVSI
ncbi:histidine phosphatase family protein [Lactovum odontotermitis]